MNSFERLLSAFERNVDFIVKTITVVASIGGVVSVILLLMTDIDNKISEKLKDPVFVKRISDEIRIPYLIFNSYGVVIFDGGATDLIDINAIKVNFHEEADFVLKSILIRTKKPVNAAPLISSIGIEEVFEDAKRIDSLTWEYKAVELDKLHTAGIDGKRVLFNFKLEMLK
jgi:hypothetical protein